jgi:hypothetical protein
MTKPYEQLHEKSAEASPILPESRPQGEELSEAELAQVAGGGNGGNDYLRNTVQGGWPAPDGTDPGGTVQGGWPAPTGTPQPS